MRDRPFQIDFSRHPAGLRVHVTGVNSLDNTVAYWLAIAAEVRERPRPVLLVDELQGEPLAADDWLKLVVSMAGQGLEHLRIAHVKPQGLDSVEYCEIYAKDAGFDARVFTDEAAAALWLRYGER